MSDTFENMVEIFLIQLYFILNVFLDISSPRNFLKKIQTCKNFEVHRVHPKMKRFVIIKLINLLSILISINFVNMIY